MPGGRPPGPVDVLVCPNCKIPDFSHTGKKLLIEFFGDFWHGEKRTGIPNEQHEKQRVLLFEKEGYKTLVIWEHELTKVSQILQKITVFSRVGVDVCVL